MDECRTRVISSNLPFYLGRRSRKQSQHDVTGGDDNALLSAGCVGQQFLTVVT